MHRFILWIIACHFADKDHVECISDDINDMLQTAYHNEFEKSKGKYTQIADDPELVRLLRNQETISMVPKRSVSVCITCLCKILFCLFLLSLLAVEEC